MENIMNVIKGTFMEGLLQELSMIKENEFIEPDFEIAAGEKVIDKMSIFEKRVCTLTHLKARKILEEIKKNILLDDAKELAKKIWLDRELISLLSKMMWYSINERNKVTSNLGIRKGFKIVSLAEKSEPKRETHIIRMTLTPESLENTDLLKHLEQLFGDMEGE